MGHIIYFGNHPDSLGRRCMTTLEYAFCEGFFLGLQRPSLLGMFLALVILKSFHDLHRGSKMSFGGSLEVFTAGPGKGATPPHLKRRPTRK